MCGSLSGWMAGHPRVTKQFVPFKLCLFSQTWACQNSPWIHVRGRQSHERNAGWYCL